MKKRSQKMCNHKWILDKQNLGICSKCGVRKQFPVEPLRSDFELANPPKYDPDSWMSASVLGIDLKEDTIKI
jgi:hypothetical protein